MIEQVESIYTSPYLAEAKEVSFHTLPNEEIVEIKHVDIQPPLHHMSVIKAILDLTAANNTDEIGLYGPSNAANASEANKDVAELNLYSEFFPRDGHVVAELLYDIYPALTEATIMASVTSSGVRENLRSPAGPQDEQEYGKVPHQIRDKNDPRVLERAMSKDRGYPYYGAIDTTSKNIRAIARYSLRDIPESLEYLETEYEARDGKKRTIEDALQSHVNWLRKRMDLNEEGLLESLWINKKHHANQSWADSPDAFHHADGSWAQHHPDKNWGVASVEVQAETYDALLDAAEMYKNLAENSEGTRREHLLEEIDNLTQRALKLRQVVMEKFWVDDPDHYGGYFGRGTDRDEDGNLRPLRIRTSDMGHLLTSRLLDGDDEETVTKREAVIRNLFSSEMLCANGLRTLSSDSLRYREDAYHNGSSWPWTSYYTAKGLERHGYYGLAYELKKRVWSFYDETKTLAEYGTGSEYPERRINTDTEVTIFDPTLNAEPIYHFSQHKIIQPPQEMQAWTVAAILAIKKENGERALHSENAMPVYAIDSQKALLEKELLTLAA